MDVTWQFCSFLFWRQLGQSRRAEEMLLKNKANNLHNTKMDIEGKAEKMYKEVFVRTLNAKDTSFSIIGIRCNSNESKGKRKMTAGLLYMLLGGYSIGENKVSKTLWRNSQDKLYDDYYTESLDGKPHIQVSAIVGQNGAGKSSIVEFMMRLINNFAAASLGEKKQGPAATRLHFIDKVNGELWYAQNAAIYHLKVKNAHVVLDELKETKRDKEMIYYEKERIVFDNELSEEEKEVKDVLEGESDEVKLKDIYSHFFYSLVSNQSIFAYNTNDFSECNSKEKEIAALGPKKDDVPYTIEELCWLHGIFHKNDGYQTPIVITPFRNEGNIDINNENLLAQERLLTLLVLQEDLRIINGHLKVKSLSYSFETGIDYGHNAVTNDIGFHQLTEVGYKKLREGIVKAWGDLLGEDLTQNAGKRPYYELSVDYLVYKTLKVSKQYKEHHEFFEKNKKMADDLDDKALKKLIEGESVDHSHITKKVMQTLAYLVFGIFDLAIAKDEDGNVKRNEAEVVFNELAGKWHKETTKREDNIMYQPLWNHIRLCALTVPPFFCFRINICKLEDEKTEIDFETLSSGEKQQIYSISSILYHLDNLNSAKDDKLNENRILYEHVNVILEEIELYYHPELQQQFVKFLIDGLNQMTLENIKSIHVQIVTHSPYVLSDIPRTNVLALKKDEEKPVTELRTFGANIHDMLKDSFFLQGGSMGYFAQWEVGHLAACMEVYRWAKEPGVDTLHLPEKFDVDDEEESYEFLKRYQYWENVEGENDKRFSMEHFKEDFPEDVLLYKIEMFDEPVVKQILLEDFHRTFPENDGGYKAAKKRELERQLAELNAE